MLRWNAIPFLFLTLFQFYNATRFHSAFLPTGSQPSPSTTVEFRIDLVQRNLDWLEDKINTVSNMDSPEYANYLTNEDIRHMVGRSAKEIHLIIVWLQSQCTEICNMETNVLVHSDYIRVKTCVERAEFLLNTKIIEYEMAHTGQKILHSLHNEDVQFHLTSAPKEVASIIEAISILGHPEPLPMRLGKNSDGSSTISFQGRIMSPKDIRSAYGLANVKRIDATDGNSSCACAEFNNSFYFDDDIKTFQDLNLMPSNPVAKVIGKNDPNSKNATFSEASADFEYITTVVCQNTWAWFNAAGTFSDAIQEVFQNPDSPRINSVSYVQYEMYYSNQQLMRTNSELIKAGASGFTWLFGSGDWGVNNPSAPKCSNYEPFFPATSPYALGIGGSYSDTVNISLEKAWTDSGSGFSNYFDIPDYQKTAIAKYLTTRNLPDSSKYNSSGRGIPDMAAFGSQFYIIEDHHTRKVVGTSLATPITAAVFTYINALRASKGKPPIGFINPVLYKASTIGYDITEGHNIQEDCNGKTENAFYAAKGWDCITGVGAPRLKALLDLFL